MHYLLKTEPSSYSFADLERERETVWDGVKNAQALRSMAAMKRGDRLVIYHSVTDKAVVGTATVKSVDATDPHHPVVKIAAGKRLPEPRRLDEMRASPLFAGSLLFRQFRLSVVPLADEQYAWLVES